MFVCAVFVAVTVLSDVCFFSLQHGRSRHRTCITHTDKRAAGHIRPPKKEESHRKHHAPLLQHSNKEAANALGAAHEWSTIAAATFAPFGAATSFRQNLDERPSFFGPSAAHFHSQDQQKRALLPYASEIRTGGCICKPSQRMYTFQSEHPSPEHHTPRTSCTVVVDDPAGNGWMGATGDGHDQTYVFNSELLRTLLDAPCCQPALCPLLQGQIPRAPEVVELPVLSFVGIQNLPFR